MSRLLKAIKPSFGCLLGVVFLCLSIAGTTALPLSCWADMASPDLSRQKQFLDLSDWAKSWSWPGKDSISQTSPATVNIEASKGSDSDTLTLNGSNGSASVTVSGLKLISGHRYRFGFQAWRPEVEHDRYLLLDLFGKKHRLNQHWTKSQWQPISVIAVARSDSRNQISLINYTNSIFRIRQPYLLDLGPAKPAQGQTRSNKKTSYSRFPLAVYVSPNRVNEVIGSPFNIVITSAGTPDQVNNLARLAQIGLKSIISCPKNPFKIASFSQLFDDIAPQARPIHFYLSDEPELHSALVDSLSNIRGLLIKQLPWATTSTAILRSRTAASYSSAYDAIFMDQYPIPHQPLNWLSDSIERVKNEIGSHTKIWAVIQAFGGGKFTKMGWPRMPTIGEFQALTFSALTAGAEGLAFYGWAYMADDPSFFTPALSFLNKLSRLTKWFPLASGLPSGATVEFVGRTKTNPSGGPAVRFGYRTLDGDLLLIAVNETPYPVHLETSGLGDSILARDIWSGDRKIISNGKIWDRLEGYGVRAWVIQERARAAK